MLIVIWHIIMITYSGTWNIPNYLTFFGGGGLAK